MGSRQMAFGHSTARWTIRASKANPQEGAAGMRMRRAQLGQDATFILSLNRD